MCLESVNQITAWRVNPELCVDSVSMKKITSTITYRAIATYIASLLIYSSILNYLSGGKEGILPHQECPNWGQEILWERQRQMCWVIPQGLDKYFRQTELNLNQPLVFLM